MHDFTQSVEGYNLIFIHASLDDAELTANQFRVFAHICRRAGMKSTGRCFASAATIAEKCRIHPDTVWGCLNELERRKMITRQSRLGNTTMWHITPPDQWVLHATKPNPPESEGCPSLSGGYPPESEGCPPPESEGCKVYPSQVNPREGNPVVKSIPAEKRFQKPTQEQCVVYGSEIGLTTDESSHFWDYQESKGWRVGTAPMKNWQASMRTWKRNRNEWARKPARHHANI